MKICNTKNTLSLLINGCAGAGLLFLTMALPASADEDITLHDTSISELVAGWWQWAEEYYPDFEFGDGRVDCSLGQSGPIWYLGGTGGGVAERECDAPIKDHVHLMFPLVNAEVSNPDDWCNVFETDNCSIEQKREILDGIFSEEPAGIFNTAGCLLQAEVDGVPAVYSASIVRTQSPTFEYDGDPEAVADGYWVILPQLPNGKHTIHFTGGICDIDNGDVIFDVEVTYDLIIAGNPKGKNSEEDDDDDLED
jgi:hypothetical protein